jgi:sugar lactone lactonase YvrE
MQRGRPVQLLPVSARRGPKFVTLLLTLAVVSAGYGFREAARADDLTGVVSAFAGSGRAGYDGDSGPATDAALSQPRMSTFDAAGRLYIADTFNNTVRVVDTDGTIGTVAGIAKEVAGDDDSLCPRRFSGDGGPALDAKLACPHSLAVSPSGRLIIADSANHRIREVDSAGIIRTIVDGTGGQGFRGDNGPAINALISDPKGIIFDAAGNLLIADTGNNRIRKVDANGIITTIVGTGAHGSGGDGGPALEAELWEPRTLAVGAGGELYITEPKINRIRKVDANGIITLLAGTTVPGFSGDGGPAVNAKLDTPRGIDVDAAGVVYIADSQNDRIRRIGLNGIITTIGGTGSARSTGDGGLAVNATFFGPRAVTVFGSDLYVTDTNGHRVRLIHGITAGPAVPKTGTTTPVTTSSTSTSSTSTSSTSSTSTSSTTSTSTTTTTTQPKPTTTTTKPPADDPLTVPSGQGPPTQSRPASGYWMLGSRGDVYAFGAVLHWGNAGTLPQSVFAVDLEPTPTGAGYWVLLSDGNVRALGDARALGGVASSRMSTGERVASISATPTGAGYWVFTDRGRAIAVGDAKFLGDVSSLTLNGPVLDSVATPSGRGYYMVASDGGIFSFGDARFYGSTGDRRLNAPVKALVPAATGNGYWLVASDGGVFAFSAPFRGSMGGTPLNRPISGMVRYGDGYLMVGADGGIFNFSSLPFAGSLGANPPASPVVAVAALNSV